MRVAETVARGRARSQRAFLGNPENPFPTAEGAPPGRLRSREETGSESGQRQTGAALPAKVESSAGRVRRGREGPGFPGTRARLRASRDGPQGPHGDDTVQRGRVLLSRGQRSQGAVPPPFHVRPRRALARHWAEGLGSLLCRVRVGESRPHVIRTRRAWPPSLRRGAGPSPPSPPWVSLGERLPEAPLCARTLKPPCGPKRPGESPG